MAKTITVASMVYDVYDTNISSKDSRLKACLAALREAVYKYYKGKQGNDHYMIFTGPEYMFARKNYTLSNFNTDDFIGTNVKKDAHGNDMEEDLDVRVKVGYSKDEKDDIVSSMKAATRNFPRLLVMPGSILWADNKKLFASKKDMYNTVPIFCDGQLVHEYHKKSPSDEIKADYRLRRDRLGIKKYKNYQERKYAFKPGSASNLFTHWGVSFGIEVCADHNQKFARKEVGDGNNVDIHCLLSAGMTPSAFNVAVGDGGVVIHNDGSTSPASQSVKTLSVNQHTNGKTLDASNEITTGNEPVRVWQVTV